ncbi:MAG: diaminopimelate decarboxylase [Abditibacteriota bacterium]|nr:diaminopimelate decarboxylase [Abditibacteriota bacterium]
MLFDNQTINSKGHLEINGCDTVELAREFGTPLYVMDEDMLRSNCRRYVQAFKSEYPEADVAYASKAFTLVGMCRLVREEGMWLDAASQGELYTAILAGCEPVKILLHGNFKTEAELSDAVRYGVKVVCDSFMEIEQLAEKSRKAGKKTQVLVRCNPGVNPHTHTMIATGQEDSKFGFNIKSGEAMEAIRKVLAKDSLVFKGIHSHIGSQLLDAEPFRAVAPVVADFCAAILGETGAAPEYMDLGGGLGVRYTEEDKPLSIEAFAAIVTDGVKKAFSSRSVPLPHLLVEPGRSIVAEAGTTLYTVGLPKQVSLAEEPFSRIYVPVDGGLSDNPRPALYDAKYTAMIANRADRPKDTLCTVSGRHCETDCLFADILLQKAEWGDIMAVQTTGAYGHSMASNYNRFMRPAVVFVSGGSARLVSRRETLEDLVKCDVI